MKKNVYYTKIISEVMKFSFTQLILFVIFCSLSYANNVKAQEILNTQVSISLESADLKKVLSQLEKQTAIKFVYSGNTINSTKKVTLKASGKKLSAILEEVLTPFHINYEVVGARIVLSKQLATTQVLFPNVETNVTKSLEEIRGKVTDAAGNGLPGVSIVVKGTTKGTLSGVSGDFSINANPGNVLVFSFVGYTPKEVTVGTGSLSVVLEESASILNDVVVVGSRFAKPRTDVDRPVAVDVINAKEIQQSGQVDLGQSIHFTAPSFNAVKFGINDSAPFVDPASLRGLGPDQVLVLVNNKRRHKVSFLSINDGVGKGQVGTDVNVVPSLSLKRIEVLRDGAAAQYGSDAIGGVINMELNDASEGGTVSVFTGIGNSKPNLDVKGVIAPEKITDGLTYNLAANFGLKMGKKGFINSTLTYNHTDGYDRSGAYKASAGFYVKDAVKDAELVKANNIDLDRAILGSAENTTYGLFVNAGTQINDKWKFYAFGGYTNKHVVTGVFTRPPSNTKRSVLEKFPNGYNPIAPADLQDFSITAGIKGKVGSGWNTDFSVGQSSNQVDFYAENTVNPSLGAASPTEFYVGQTKITQTLINADIAKTFKEGSYPNMSVAAGTEFRYETFGLKAGDPASYESGPLFKTKDVGSSGREGFSNKAAGDWGRTNIGVYAEIESDITKNFLIGGAARVENYSDFGSNFSYKLNSRLRLADPFAVRASVSRGFRAPSMVQAYYSNYVNISFDNAGNSIINPIIPATSSLAKLLGVNGLEQETSFDVSVGVTSKIGDHLTLTADAYQIDVDNRIMLSGSVDVSKIPEFVAAGFPQTANVFVNAIDTRTKGLEFVANYNNNIGAKSKINLALAYSSMVTTLRANRKTSTGVEVADQTATLYITDGLPKNKLIGSVTYDYAKFGIMVRATRFGEVSDPLATLAVKPTDPNAKNYQVFAAKTLLDLSVSYRPIEKLNITAGVNNLLDVYPDLLQVPQTTNEVIFSRRTNQFGTQGRFLNLTATYNF